MAIANAREMLLEATAEGYAVGAFNVTNLIQMLAVVEAATEKLADAKHPVRTAHHIVDKALEAEAVERSREPVAKVVYHVTNGFDRA